MSSNITPILIDMNDTSFCIKLSKPTIYHMFDEQHELYDPTFPTPIKQGRKNVFLFDEIDTWARNLVIRLRRQDQKPVAPEVD